MKYIKTTDGIFEISDKEYDLLCGNLTEREKEIYKNITSIGIGSIEEGTYKSILIKDIINQANTIEELCDGFYLEFGEVFDITNVYEKERYKDFQNFYNQLNDTLIINAYGFIKTSKGLIYVAKMNEKGELCLI